MSDARGAASWDAKRATPAEQAAYGEGYDQAHDDVWEALVCSVCGENHDADESAMCEGGEVVSFREWVEACGRLREQLAESEAANESYAVEATMAREQLDAARQGLKHYADQDNWRCSHRWRTGQAAGYVFWQYDSRDKEPWTAARAALGVVSDE